MATLTKVIWSYYLSDRQGTLTIKRMEFYEKSGRLKSGEERVYDLSRVRGFLWDSKDTLLYAVVEKEAT